MSVDTQKIIEIVKQVKPLFLDREGSSQIKVKGVADFVTQIDFKVQEQVKTALYELYSEIRSYGEKRTTAILTLTVMSDPDLVMGRPT